MLAQWQPRLLVIASLITSLANGSFTYRPSPGASDLGEESALDGGLSVRYLTAVRPERDASSIESALSTPTGNNEAGFKRQDSTPLIAPTQTPVSGDVTVGSSAAGSGDNSGSETTSQAAATSEAGSENGNTATPANTVVESSVDQGGQASSDAGSPSTTPSGELTSTSPSQEASTDASSASGDANDSTPTSLGTTAVSIATGTGETETPVASSAASSTASDSPEQTGSTAQSDQESTPATSAQGPTTTPSDDDTSALSSQTETPASSVETSTNQDDTTQLSSDTTQTTTPSDDDTTALSSQTETPASSVETTTDEDDTTQLSSDTTQTDTSETDTSGTPVESTASPEETSTAPESTETSDTTTGSSDAQPTSTESAPPVTSYQSTTASGQQTIITGTDGEVATWSASKDPEYSDNTKTVTTTDDGGGLIIIWPWGWVWKLVGGIKTGPTPTSNPNPDDDNDDDDDNNDDDNDDDDDDDDDDECTTTAPPDCTRTVSTEFGDCPSVTGCASGHQSTTTTTVTPVFEAITGDAPSGQPAAEPTNVEDPDESAFDYWDDMFEEWQIANEATNDDLEAGCEGVSWGASKDCLGTFADAFCDVVGEYDYGAVSKKFTYDDLSKRDELKPVVTGALRRKSLSARKESCGSYTFAFEWSGQDGDCSVPCTEAFEELQTQCYTLGFLGLASQGSLDVGCGTYKYSVNKTGVAVSTSTEASSTTSKATTKTTSTTTTTSKTTSTSASPTTTTVSVEPHGGGCYNEADLPGHADLQETSVEFFTRLFCYTYWKNGTTVDPSVTGDDAIDVTSKDTDGNRHQVTFEWREGCETESDEMSVYYPMGEKEDACPAILYDTWQGCVNGGVGGWTYIGCVKYSIKSGV